MLQNNAGRKARRAPWPSSWFSVFTELSLRRTALPQIQHESLGLLRGVRRHRDKGAIGKPGGAPRIIAAVRKPALTLPGAVNLGVSLNLSAPHVPPLQMGRAAQPWQKALEDVTWDGSQALPAMCCPRVTILVSTGRSLDCWPHFRHLKHQGCDRFYFPKEAACLGHWGSLLQHHY